MVGEEYTIAGPNVQAPPSTAQRKIHLLDRRAIRWSQVVHGKRAQCEPIGNHRQDVPSVRFGGRDDAHLQDVDLRPLLLGMMRLVSEVGRKVDGQAQSHANPQQTARETNLNQKGRAPGARGEQTTLRQ